MFQVLILIAALAAGHSIQKSDQVCREAIARLHQEATSWDGDEVLKSLA